MNVFTFPKPFVTIVTMFVLYQFSLETTVSECSITTAFWVKFEQLQATPEDYCYLQTYGVISTSIYFITTELYHRLDFKMYYSARAKCSFLPMLIKVKNKLRIRPVIQICSKM